MITPLVFTNLDQFTLDTLKTYMRENIMNCGSDGSSWICSSLPVPTGWSRTDHILSRVTSTWTLATCHLWTLLELSRQDLLRVNFILRDVLWKVLSYGVKEEDHTVGMLPCRFILLFFTFSMFSLCFLWKHNRLAFLQVVCKDFPRPPLENTINYLEAGQLSSFFRSSQRPSKPLQVVIAGAGLT